MHRPEFRPFVLEKYPSLDLCFEQSRCIRHAQGKIINVDSTWNVMAHGDAREGKWRGNWRMEWAASTHHTTSEHGVSSITTADAHTSAASSRLNWRPRLFKCTRPFGRKTKSGFCACAITFQPASTDRVKNYANATAYFRYNYEGQHFWLPVTTELYLACNFCTRKLKMYVVSSKLRAPQPTNIVVWIRQFWTCLRV